MRLRGQRSFEMELLTLERAAVYNVMGLKEENCSLGMRRFITVYLASLQLEKEDAR